MTVFVPETTTETAKDLIRQEGADVVVQGASWRSKTNERSPRSTRTRRFCILSTIRCLWSGHATMIDEVVRSGVGFDVVVLSVGGGGLLAGVAEGLARNGLQDTPIIAVETEGAASLSAAVKEGRLVELSAISSIATSLGARKVCERAFELDPLAAGRQHRCRRSLGT